jgi:hypothetical protein
MIMNRNRIAFSFLLPAALLLLTAHCSLLTCRAQSTTATLSGTVEDQNKAVVPSARVRVINLGTGLEREALTNDSGDFTIPLLPPSTYTVRVERDGFATVEISKVVLNIGDQKALRIELKTGPVTAMVKINADAPLINESPAVGTVVDRQFVENLPLNGRSFQSLIALTPGVVLTRANTDTPGQFSVNGQRANANYFMIDGVGANIGVSPGTNVGVQTAGTTPGLGATGGTNNLVSIDALQEFKILTSSFAPEFGRTPGAQVQILTRSGTNEYHGSLFEYFRNEVLDANDWFANRIGSKRAPLRQNDFGGVLGGPLPLPRFGEGGPSFINGKDRTFFFFSYEGLRLRLPNTAVTTVPSLAIRTSALPAIQPFLNAFPRPNGPDLGNNLASFNSTFSNPSSLDATSIRIDHAVSSKLTFFGRYNHSPSEANIRGAGFSLSTINNSSYKTQTLTGGVTWLLGATASNDFRINYSRNVGELVFLEDNFGGAIPLLDSQLYALPIGSTETGNFFGSFGAGLSLQKGRFGLDVQRQINLVDTFSISKGTHQLKFGADYRRLFPLLDRTRYSLQASFASVTAAATTGRATALASLFSGPLYPVFDNLSLFVQDVWKVNQRLTLTYGSRWELNPSPTEANGNDPFALAGLASPSTIAFAPAGTPLYHTTYNNFAPRIGLAYQLRQQPGSESVLRGGFGVFYDLGNGSVANAFGVSYPYFVRKVLSNVPFPLDAANAALPSLAPPFNVAGAIDPDIKIPYTFQWNVSLEQSLGSNQTVSASYVAAVGRRLLRQEVISNPNPTFSSIRLSKNSGSSDYHAAQIQFQRRLSRGLQALVSYTWSHSIDNVSNDVSGEAPEFLIDLRQERGPSDFDVRHAFNAAATYDIPSHKTRYLKTLFGGFSLDAIFAARTAFPVNVITGTNIIGGNGVSRPDLVPNVPLYLKDPLAPGGWRINRAAFTIPVGRQGTLGRNALHNFPMWQLDLALRRQFKLSERMKLQVRAEVFNIFNHPNFIIGDLERRLNNLTTFGVATTMLGRGLGLGGASGGFNPLYQVGGPRSIQLAVKLGF